MCKCKNVVYKATYNRCQKFYIGNTQCDLKTRFNQHYCDVKKRLEKGKNKTRFSKHFASCYQEEYGTKVYNVKKMKKLVRHEVLWEGNPLSCVKTYGTKQCTLCAEEKYAIWSETGRNFKYCLNKRKEIFSKCAHNVYFHHFYRGTEEPTGRGEKKN